MKRARKDLSDPVIALAEVLKLLRRLSWIDRARVIRGAVAFFGDPS